MSLRVQKSHGGLLTPEACFLPNLCGSYVFAEVGDSCEKNDLGCQSDHVASRVNPFGARRFVSPRFRITVVRTLQLVWPSLRLYWCRCTLSTQLASRREAKAGHHLEKGAHVHQTRGLLEVECTWQQRHVSYVVDLQPTCTDVPCTVDPGYTLISFVVRAHIV
jgi:hypothetical protein